MGIKLFICDLDNTLSPHFVKHPTSDVKRFIKSIQELGIKFVLCSNNRKKRVNEYSKDLKADYVITFAMKPFKRKIIKLMNKLDMTPDEVLIMGDQFITDIFLANRIICKSILVKPMVNPINDSSVNPIVKMLDKFIYKKLSYGNDVLLNNNSNNITDETAYL
jgi:HAD superfamily phosphatase (TIGR01668 family)